MRQIGSFKHKDTMLYLYRTLYPEGGAPAVYAETEDGEMWGVLSVNLPEMNFTLKKDEFFVKTWSENEDWARPMLTTGLFYDTGVRVSTGFVRAEVWKFTKQ